MDDIENGNGRKDKPSLTKEIAALKAYIKDAIRSIQVSKDLRESTELQNHVRKWIEKMKMEMVSLEKKGATDADLTSILEEIKQFNYFVNAAEEKNRANSKSEIAKAIDGYIEPRKARYLKKNLPPELKETFEKFNQLTAALYSLRDNCFDRGELLKAEEIKKNYAGFNILSLVDQITHKSYSEANEEFSGQEKYLCKKMVELFRYGAKLLQQDNFKDQALGQLTCDLASDLSYKAQIFFNNRILKSQKKERENFVNELTIILHSQDKAMQLHRSYVKKLLSNIIKGLALILSGIGAIIYAGVTGENPVKFFQKPKTERNLKLEEIEKIALIYA